MPPRKYRVAVFAHNDEDLIERGLRSIYASFRETPADLKIYVLVNGSKDRTPQIVRAFSASHPEVQPIEIAFGDKCNAWNTFVYQYLDDQADCHFFMDGDIVCSAGAFELMAAALEQQPRCTAVGGLPLSGRSKAYYQKIAIDWSWLYGGLYTVRTSQLLNISRAGIRLPLGLRGNDHVITALVKADFGGGLELRDEWLTHVPGCGYQFSSLQPYRWKDVQVYRRRRIVYNWRKRQLLALALPPRRVDEMPADMDDINYQILADLEKSMSPLDLVSRAVRRRLRQMYPTAAHRFYGNPDVQRQLSSVSR